MLKCLPLYRRRSSVFSKVWFLPFKPKKKKTKKPKQNILTFSEQERSLSFYVKGSSTSSTSHSCWHLVLFCFIITHKTLLMKSLFHLSVFSWVSITHQAPWRTQWGAKPKNSLFHEAQSQVRVLDTNEVISKTKVLLQTEISAVQGHWMVA